MIHIFPAMAGTFQLLLIAGQIWINAGLILYLIRCHVAFCRDRFFVHPTKNPSRLPGKGFSYDHLIIFNSSSATY
jgi:hypothetical protein